MLGIPRTYRGGVGYHSALTCDHCCALQAGEMLLVLAPHMSVTTPQAALGEILLILNNSVAAHNESSDGRSGGR